MDARRRALDLAAAAAVGSAFVGTHASWYGVVDQSPAVDVAGSAVLGLVAAVAYVLVTGRRRDRGPIGLAFGIGFLIHLLLTPAFTPVGLAAAEVNLVLFLAGAAFGLGCRYRAKRQGTAE